MKKLFNRQFLAPIFTFLFIAGFSITSHATHFRYAAYSYKILSHDPITNTTEVQFNITQAWRSSFPWSGGGAVTAVGQTRPVGTFNFGDGTSATLILTATFLSPDDWFSGQATLIKTYTGSLDRVAIFQNCCRISTLSGGNNDRNYINRITVKLSDPTNNSPAVNTPPILFVGQGLPAAAVQINGFDEDGDAITYSIATSAQSGLLQAQPPFLTSLSPAGLITLNTVGVALNSRWALQVYLTDARGAQVPLDFIIEIVTASNPPVFTYPPTPANASVINTTAGATVTFDVSATDPDPGIVNLSAIGVPIGASFITANGNPANGTFTWSPALNQPGAYNIIFTAQDNLFNQATSSVTINVQPCTININASQTNVSCNGANDGAIDLTLTGNFGTPTAEWTGPNGFAFTGEDISGLEPGVYTVVVTSSFGCQATAAFTITEPAPIVVNYNATSILCFGGLSQESITITGGTAPYDVLNGGGGALALGLLEGQEKIGQSFAANYVYTVTDANGCTFSFNADITEPPSLGCSISASQNTITLGYGNQSATLTAVGNGGTPGYSFDWNTGDSGPSVSVSPLTTTIYTATITDDNGCVSSCSITIEVIDARCGKKMNKVLVCKVPPDNPGNAHNICVAAPAVPAHLATGSYVGPCASNKNAEILNEFSIYPNPGNGIFNIEYQLIEEGNFVLNILTITGQRVHSEVIQESAGRHQMTLDLSRLSAGTYLVQIVSNQIVETEKLIIQ